MSDEVPLSVQKDIIDVMSADDYELFKWDTLSRSNCVPLRKNGKNNDPPPENWKLADRPEFALIRKSMALVPRRPVETAILHQKMRQTAINKSIRQPAVRDDTYSLFPDHQAVFSVPMFVVPEQRDNYGYRLTTPVKVNLVPQVSLPRMQITLMRDVLRLLTVSTGEKNMVAGLLNRCSLTCADPCVRPDHKLTHRDHLKSIAGGDLMWHNFFFTDTTLQGNVPDITERSSAKGWREPRSVLEESKVNGFDWPLWHLDIVTPQAFRDIVFVTKRGLLNGDGGGDPSLPKRTNWVNIGKLCPSEGDPPSPYAESDEPAFTDEWADQLQDLDLADFIVLYTEPVYPNIPVKNVAVAATTGATSATTNSPANSESPVPSSTGPFSTAGALKTTPTSRKNDKNKSKTPESDRVLKLNNLYASTEDATPEYRWSFELVRKLTPAERDKRRARGDYSTHQLIYCRPYVNGGEYTAEDVKQIVQFLQSTSRTAWLHENMAFAADVASRERPEVLISPELLVFPEPFQPDMVGFRAQQHLCLPAIVFLVRHWVKNMPFPLDRCEQMRVRRQLLLEVAYDVKMPESHLNADFPVDKQRRCLMPSDCIPLASPSSEFAESTEEANVALGAKRDPETVLLDIADFVGSDDWKKHVFFLLPEDQVVIMAEVEAAQQNSATQNQTKLLESKVNAKYKRPNLKRPLNAGIPVSTGVADSRKKQEEPDVTQAMTEVTDSQLGKQQESPVTTEHDMADGSHFNQPYTPSPE